MDQEPGEWIEAPRIDKSPPQTLTVAEVDLLLDMPDVSQTSGLRDKAMLELIYATGIRVSELIALDVTDVDTAMKFVRCSGGKERIIPMGTVTAEWLEKYLRESRPKMLNRSDTEVLFPNAREIGSLARVFGKSSRSTAGRLGSKRTLLRIRFAIPSPCICWKAALT